MVNYQSLLGRQWNYGVCDCFTLVRDYFALEGVRLPDFARPADLETCDSIFLEQAERVGFVRVDFASRLPGDLLVLKLGTKAPMHGAILLSDERILHQRQDSLSAIEPFGRYYASRVAAVFRYAADRSAAR